MQKYPSLNPKVPEVQSIPHNYYENNYVSHDNKENAVQHYNRYKKGAQIVRKSADPTATRINRVNNISSIIEGVEKRINDVLANKKLSKDRQNSNCYQPTFEV
jgi:hypothetical protein